MTLTFRPAGEADVPAVVAIVNGAYRGDATGRGWTHEAELVAGPRIDAPRLRALLAQRGSVVLVAERGGAIVGSVHLRAEGATCHLGMLAVQVAGQAAGVGKALVAAAEAHARDALGARTMDMHVVSVRAELIAWYERRGYARTGEVVPFAPGPGEGFLQGPLAFARLVKRLDGPRG